MKYINNPNKKVYNIDFDGTLTTGESYEVLEPNHAMLNKVKQLYFAGHIIIIWSARSWMNGHIIASWLIRHDVDFHGIMLGKGGSDYYIDDKAINAEDFINNDAIINKP